jgi:hypothetical protein|tara:strand:- start:610 stop:2451 length:1842 start_codon:yes stop_codon:yes gene_type:complete
MAVGSLLRSLGRYGEELIDTKSPTSQATKLIGGGAGGIAGGTDMFTQDMDDPTRDQGEMALRAVGGGILGAYAGPGMMRSMAVAKSGPDRLANALYYNYLSSPDTITRANLGAAGAMMMHGFESFITGDWDTANKLFGATKKAGNTWLKVLGGDKETVHKLRQKVLGSEYKFEVGEEFRDIGLGKWYTAGDLAAVEAMTDMGLTPAEAMRYTLTGSPETAMGQGLLKMQSEMLRGPGYAGKLLAATAMPFARVGVMGMEQGLRRTPILGLIPQSKKFGGPGMLSKQSLGQQASGTLAGAAGMGIEDELDPRFSQTLGTGAGPAFLPFAMGRGISRGLQREEPLGTPTSKLNTILRGAGAGLTEFNPLGFQPLGLVQNTAQEIPRRFIPAGVGDVAEAIDPAFGRVSAQGDLEQRAREGLTPRYQAEPGVGQFMARIPGLREKLPEDYMPVTPEGQPRFAQREALSAAGADENPLIRGMSRVMAPTRQQSTPPVRDMRDPDEQYLHNLGITRAAPSPRGSIAGIPFFSSADATSQMQQLRGTGADIGKQVLTSPPLKAMLAEMSESNPQLARLMAQILYQSITSGIGRATGVASTMVGLQGLDRPLLGGPRRGG